jgi:hypothetical protein
MTAVALVFLFLLVAFKITFALIAHRRGGFPPRNGGSDSSGRSELRPPGGRPHPFPRLNKLNTNPPDFAPTSDLKSQSLTRQLSLASAFVSSPTQPLVPFSFSFSFPPLRPLRPLREALGFEL